MEAIIHLIVVTFLLHLRCEDAPFLFQFVLANDCEGGLHKSAAESLVQTSRWHTALLISLQHFVNDELIWLGCIQTLKLAFVVQNHFRSNDTTLHCGFLRVDLEVDLLFVKLDDKLVWVVGGVERVFGLFQLDDDSKSVFLDCCKGMLSACAVLPTLRELTLARLQNEWDALPTVVVDSQHDLAKRRSLGLFVLDGFVLEVARLVAVSSVLAHYSLIVGDRLDGF